MNKDHKLISEQSKKVHDESQSPRDNMKIGESAEAMQGHQTIIEL